MAQIVISASTKHYTTMSIFAETIRNLGYTVYAPTFEPFPGGSEQAIRSHQQAMIKRHNDEIDNCELLFVYNPSGYVGISVTIEMGYALAKNKPIFTLEADPELGRSVLVTDVCSTPEALVRSIGGLRSS